MRAGYQFCFETGETRASLRGGCGVGRSQERGRVKDRGEGITGGAMPRRAVSAETRHTAARLKDKRWKGRKRPSCRYGFGEPRELMLKPQFYL